jgi:3-oxoacyl-[acyl-carrier-protein] synthase III
MCVPRRCLTNDEISQTLDTSDEWIRSRTGIETRYIVEDGESTAQLSIAAAQAALQVADADPRDIDLILLATATPDHPLPATACQVQNALGATHAGAVDLNAGCSGFVYALAMGHQAIASGEHELVLVIGADSLSRTVDWQDRSICVLFGDGAGAVLLRSNDGPSGVLATLMGADGSGADLLIIPAGGSARPTTPETLSQGLNYLQMNGREVYRFATRTLPRAIQQVVDKAGLPMTEIDWVVPHQANGRIIDTAADRLKLSKERFIINLQRYGNTSAASVPIALCEALNDGRIHPGQSLVLVGFGAGLTWAAVALRWGVEPEEAVSPKWRIWWRALIYRWARLRTGVRRAGHWLTVGLIRTAEKHRNGRS